MKDKKNISKYQPKAIEMPIETIGKLKIEAEKD
jgi:hypothetical protein